MRSLVTFVAAVSLFGLLRAQASPSIQPPADRGQGDTDQRAAPAPVPTEPPEGNRNPQHSSQAGEGNFGPSIQFDTKGVEFGPWIRRFIAQIKRTWVVPLTAMSDKGHVVVTFNIHKDGTITDLTVTVPSPIEALNIATVGALTRASPTMALPQEYPATKAFFTITFYYNETPQEALEQPSSLLKATSAEVEQRLGKPSQIDGHRWTYRTTVGRLAVYFDDENVVIDVQPRAFDLSTFRRQ